MGRWVGWEGRREEGKGKGERGGRKGRRRGMRKVEMEGGEWWCENDSLSVEPGVVKEMQLTRHSRSPDDHRGTL